MEDNEIWLIAYLANIIAQGPIKYQGQQQALAAEGADHAVEMYRARFEHET
jgi:hypothetical protein